MKRIQIQLTDDELKLLRLKARDHGTSVSSVIRQAVDLYLRDGAALPASPSSSDRWRRSLSAIGRFSGGHGNAGEEHDRFLESAYRE